MNAQELYEFLEQFTPQARSDMRVIVHRNKHQGRNVVDIQTSINREESILKIFCKGEGVDYESRRDS